MDRDASQEQDANKTRLARGCEIVGCTTGILAVFALLIITGTVAITRLFAVSKVVAVASSAIGSVLLFVFVALAGSWTERVSIRRKVAKWNSWKCPHCSNHYALRKGDAVEWFRRVYTADRGQHHTNESGIRLRCRTCDKTADFLPNGSLDTFLPDPSVTLVGGHEIEVDIAE